MGINKKLSFYFLSLFIFGILALNVIAFDFVGYTYNVTKGAINGTNVTINVYQMQPDQPPTLNSTYSALSNEAGFFNVTNIIENPQLFYKPIIRHYNTSSGDADYVGQSLPDFPYMEIQRITQGDPIDFYLKEGATINITAIGTQDRLQGASIAWSTVLDTTFLNATELKGLEWNNVTNTWSYLTIGSGSNLVVIYNYDFSFNKTYEVNFVNIADFDIVNNEYFIINRNDTSNTSIVRKYIDTTTNFVLNQTIDLTQNYTYITGLEFDNCTGKNFFYVLGTNTTSDTVLDRYVYNTTHFVYNTTYAFSGDTGKLDRPNCGDFWYVLSDGGLWQFNNSFDHIYDWGIGFTSFGVEYFEGYADMEEGWYALGNQSSNMSLRMELYSSLVKSFNYMVKDVKLGYDVASEWQSFTTQVTVYLPADRNYSIMIYPNMSFPVSYDLNNITDYTNNHVDIQFNTSSLDRRVSGYVLNGSTAGYNEFGIVGYLIEPGNMVFPDHPIPYNMSAWSNSSDIYNLGTGFYNITLPGAAMGAKIMLFATVRNGSNFYGAFRNITLDYSSDEITGFNFNLTALLGSPANISVERMAYDGPPENINISTKKVSFQLQNESGSGINDTAHLELEIDYSSFTNGPTFTWMTDVQSGDSGIFQLPMLNANISRINVFTQQFAPLKTSVLASEMTSTVNISLSTFDPKGVGEEEFNDLFIDMLRSSAVCDVPYPPAGCSLFPAEKNMTNFDPFTIVIGGGKISLRMRKMSNNITVHYINVDLMASGPPDAMFDENATESQSGSALEAAWRFGSNGPEIYDEVIIGMPYDTSTMDDDYTPTPSIVIANLYDNNWNNEWNTTTYPNGTSIPSDYSGFNPLWFNATAGGVPCSKTNQSALCYMDTERNMLWLRIPHFSGVGPQVQGYAALGTIASDRTAYQCYPSCTAYINLTMNNTNLAQVWNLSINNTAIASGIKWVIEYYNLSDNNWVSSGENNTALQNYNLILYNDTTPNNTTHQFRLTITLPSAMSTKWNFTININGTQYTLDPYLDSINLSSPANNSILATGSNNFVFTLYSNNYTTQNCTLYIDGTAITSNSTTQNGTPTTLIASLSAANVNWSIGCNDTGNSQTWYYTVDTTGPVVTVNTTLSPTSTYYSNTSQNWNFNFTPTDNQFSTIKQCNLTINGVVNKTINDSANGTLTGFSALNFTDGVYSWSIICLDNLSNTGNSTLYTFTMDNSSPIITINSPTNNSMHGNNYIVFNISVYDLIPRTTDFCVYNLTQDTTSIKSGAPDSNEFSTSNYNHTYSTTLTSLSEGYYNLTVNCTDYFNNTSQTTYYNILVDTTDPVVTVNTTLSPTSTYYSNTSQNWNFNFTPTDNQFSTIKQCNLTINGAVNQTINNSANGTLAGFNSLNFTDGMYNWSILCMDNLSNTGNSTLYTFTMDNSSPIITINSPTNNSLQNNSYFTFNISVYDLIPKTTDFCVYNLTQGTTDVKSGSPDASDFTSSNYNHTYSTTLTAVNNGNYNLTVNCTDYFNNTAQKMYNLTVNDTTVPTVTAISANSSGTTTVTVTLSVTTNEAATCQYSTSSDVVYGSMSAMTTTGSTSHSKSIAYTSDASGTYYVRCQDTAGNSMSTSNSTTFTADVTTTGGGGGGGGGISQTINPKTSKQWDEIPAATPSIMKVTNSEIGLTQITITVDNKANNVEITIEKLAGKPASITKTITGQVYKYLELDKTNLEDENVDTVEIEFRVEKSWLTQNNVQENNIVLMRYNNNKWNELPTHKKSSDTKYIYYTASSPGLSYFAIAEKGASLPEVTTGEAEAEAEAEAEGEAVVVTGEAEAETEGETEAEATSTKALKISKSTILVVLIAIILIAAIIFLLTQLKSKNKKPHPLDKYVKEVKERGHARHAVKKRLLESGWDEETAEHHLNKHYKKN